MDLRLSGAPVTDAERDVIAATVPAAVSVDLDGRVERSGRAARNHRQYLLPALAAVNDEFGWISPGALDEICRRLHVPPAEAYGVATFYALLSTDPMPATVAHVCDDIGCAPFGEAADPVGALAHAVDDLGAAEVQVKPSPCLGQCDRRPAVFVQRAGADNVVVTRATAAATATALVDDVALNRAARNGAARNDGAQTPGGDDAPVAAALGPARLLQRTEAAPEDLDAYRARGGYQALDNALAMGADQVIAAITEANLRGRGGAAFPTGIKWRAVADQPGPRYLICNADESEPGTFKDRVLIESNPLLLIEAMTIAATAMGAATGYLYLRGEYPLAARRIADAIAMATDAGLLGTNIAGSGHDFEIILRRGQGAYICGEETALMESIEGRRGEPRNKPPFPTTHGLFGQPTAVNNVETLANVPFIIAHGPAAFRSVGTEQSAGTRLFCLSGSVARPGTYEAPLGATLGALIEAAGGPTEPMTAILVGGAAGSFVTPDDLDVPMTFEDTQSRGMSMGSGVVMVFGESVDMAAVVRRIAAFFRDESCGQCVPCRVGVVRQQEALERLLRADRPDTVMRERGLLGDLDQVMTDASICGLGQTAASAVRSALKLGLVG